jgi:hypothetical protein
MIGDHPGSRDSRPTQEFQMSRRNGDRARFQKDRKRKMLRRQRLQELFKAAPKPQPAAVSART